MRGAADGEIRRTSNFCYTNFEVLLNMTVETERIIQLSLVLVMAQLLHS